MEYFGGFNLVVSYLYDPDEIFAENLGRCGVRHLVRGTPKPVELHAADHYCKPLESLAIYQNHAVPRIYLTAADRIAAAKFLGELARNRIVAIHPGSGGKSKMWPVEKFAVLGRWIADELAARLLIVEGEADGEVVGKLAQMLSSRVAARAKGLKLVELAAVLERCACFVGNDSGISHVAAATGTPTVAMFGPASSALWEPRGDRVRVVAFGETDVNEARQAIHELGWG
jgi:ADP-heptose:LPS heptosyltransferase